MQELPRRSTASENPMALQKGPQTRAAYDDAIRPTKAASSLAFRTMFPPRVATRPRNENMTSGLAKALCHGQGQNVHVVGAIMTMEDIRVEVQCRRIQAFN